MSRTLLVTTIALLLTVGFAQATVTAGHDGGVAVTDMPGYSGFTVSLVSDTADDPAGYAGTMDGPMNQIMAIGALPTPTLDLADLIAPPFGLPEQDSHFLLYYADLLTVIAPNETGNQLGMEAAIMVAARSNPLPLAYLVIADGNYVHVTGEVADASENLLYQVDLIVPEPLTVTLLALGGLALLRRKRGYRA